jgi:hypothetical protein
MGFKIKLKGPKIKLKAPKIRAPRIRLGRVKGPNFKPVLKAAGTVTKSADSLVKKAQRKIKKVPVAGTLVSSLYDWTYGAKVELVRQIAKGERIDKAAYAALKVKVKAGQELAPYAQTIISMVPGVGPGVSGAIGAANALSKGRRIDEALYEGIKDSIPGGPAARAAFEVSYALASGKDPGKAALQAIPVGPTEKRLIVEGVGAVTDLAKGKKLNEVLVDRGIAAMPDAKTRKAAQIGIALAEGKRLQDIAYQAMPLVMPKLAQEGGEISKSNPLFKVGLEALKNAPESRKGYVTAIGFMSHKENDVTLDAALKLLKNVKEKEGFELGLAAVIGADKIGKRPNKSNKKNFGKVVRAGAGKKGKTAKGDSLVKAVQMLDPEIAAGVKEQEEETWFDRFVDFVGDLF